MSARSNLPILIADPDTLSPAERLLWGYGVVDPTHIDLDAIAFDQRAEVRYRKMDGCEARLVALGDRAVISIDTGCSLARRRFSLAHELAHWIADRGKGSFLCAADDIGPQNAEARSVETRANEYASQLVLPDYLVLRSIEGQPASLDTARKLAHTFNVSITAAAIKLCRRTSIPTCVACHGQTRLRWFVRNRAFPPDLFLRRELHHETDAFLMIFGKLAGVSTLKREPGDRWLIGHGSYRLTVQAQSVRLPDGTALSLVSIPK